MQDVVLAQMYFHTSWKLGWGGMGWGGGGCTNVHVEVLPGTEMLR